MGQFDAVGVPQRGTPAEEISSGHATSRKRYPWLWMIAVVILVVAVWYYQSSQTNSQPQDSKAAPADGKSSAGAGPGGAGFAVPVVVATAQRGDLPVYFNGLGTVTAFNTVTVRSRIDGQLIKVDFTEGQFVHQGELLAEIDPRPYQVQLSQAEGLLAKDQAQRKDAEVNLQRFQLLFKEGVIAQQQLDTQRAQVGQFDGSIRSDEGQINNAKLQLNYCRITAPISGRVGLRLVDAGNMVHAADANGLVVITQLQPISVVFSLPQDQLPPVYSKLRAGQHLPVEAFDRDDTAKIASGKLVTIDNQIDATTGTYKLKSMFTNENNILFPNQFVNVHLLVDTKKDLVTIPAPAVQRGPQGPYVYVAGNDGTVKIRALTVAQTVGNTVGVSAGLEPGEVVVVDGQDKLQDGTKIRATPASNSSSAASSNLAGESKPNNTPAGADARSK
ncbi:MAG: MdtA/MuxA family multidrug efflux RND transporter periplasmic adaptor subunit [Candidatus Acidiferrum sp.]